MPESLVERGIAETRAVLVEGSEIVEARILLDGVVPSGSIIAARLVDIGRGGRNAVARDGTGIEYLLPRAPAGMAEGSATSIEVTREAIPGGEPWKRPLARIAEASATPAPAVAGRTLPLPAPHDVLADFGWWDLVDEARSGLVRFAGGELRVSVTPAMTLIDVDGNLPPKDLAMAGVRAAALTVRRHGIGGSIGIDLPTVQGKAERQAIGEAFDKILPQPFKRTAVNGFGFLQVVRPRRHASLFELTADRVPFEARQLLRRAAFGAGAKTLRAHPAVTGLLQSRPDWMEALARQIGGEVRLRADATLPISGGHVEG